MISLTCTGCGKGYKVADEAAGKRTKCKQCGTAITIPAAPSFQQPPLPVAVLPDPDADFGDYGGGEVFQPSPSATPPPLRRRAAPVPVAQKSGFSLGFKIERVSLIILAIGIALLVFGYREYNLSTLASDTPQNLSCQALVDNGPGSNINIRMTDFVALSPYMHKGEQNASRWKEVYIPLVPVSSLPKATQAAIKKHGTKFIENNNYDSSKVHILLKSTSCGDAAAVESLVNQGSIDGMITNKIDSIEHDDNVLLTQAYPSMDIPDAYIFEEGRKPRGGVGMLLAALGVLLVLAAVANVLRPR